MASSSEATQYCVHGGLQQLKGSLASLDKPCNAIPSQKRQKEAFLLPELQLILIANILINEENFDEILMKSIEHNGATFEFFTPTVQQESF